MAKHLYSPDLSMIWRGLYEFLLQEHEDPPPSFEKVVALLTERDHTLENALLGDLVVNNVSGYLNLPPPIGRQIGWSSNVGVVSGVTDGAGYFQITYASPFETDTVVPLFFSSVQFPSEFLGAGATIVAGSVNKAGFQIRLDFSTPISGGYLAIGY